MHVYLSKKVAIPNNVTLRTINWHYDEGYLACGGDEGFLKVIKIEAQQNTLTSTTVDTAKLSVLPQSTIVMNQTLEAHIDQVVLSVWNQKNTKLTTADSTGMIVVWVLHKGVWYEEMINNRNKSAVTGLHWTGDGSKIAIVYEDGTVVVGSVEGGRIWSKDFQIKLANVQWNPEGTILCMATFNGDLNFYDGSGTLIGKYLSKQRVKVTSMHWHEDTSISDKNMLAVAYANGDVYFFKNERDKDPLTVNTNLYKIVLKWNRQGTALAVAGQHDSGLEVLFFDANTNHNRTLKIPGKELNDIAWDNHGLKLALAVDSFIYFANFKLNYNWSFFATSTEQSGVVCYTQEKQGETTLHFWNSRTLERTSKPLTNVIGMKAIGDMCFIVAKATSEYQGSYSLQICDAIGKIMCSKLIEFEPKLFAVSKTHVLCVSVNGSFVYLWHYNRPTLLNEASEIKTAFGRALGALEEEKSKEQIEYRGHWDDILSNASVKYEEQMYFDLRRREPSLRPIQAAALSDNHIYFVDAGGILFKVSLGTFKVENSWENLKGKKIRSVHLNVGATKMVALDICGNASLLYIDDREDSLAIFERKDVCDVIWATDNPDLFALIEKNRLYIFRGLDPEEPLTTMGNLGEFSDLLLHIVRVENLIESPETPSKSLIEKIDTKSLRDTKKIVEQVGIADALQFVKDNPHPKLWRLVGDAALGKLDFANARTCFVHCLDYYALQTVKRVERMDDKQMQQAEIFIYFGKFDDAEKLYLDIGRADLAIDLRNRLGDLFKSAELMKTNAVVDDNQMEKAWNAIGDYYFERRQWMKALSWYRQSKNVSQQIECLYIVEDYDGLTKLITEIAESDPLLQHLASKLLSVGMSSEAAMAFVRANDVRSAVDACVQMNNWEKAVRLAEHHRYRELDQVVQQYANHQLEQKKHLDAIRLYHKATYHEQSASILQTLARKSAKNELSPLVMKQIHVLAALELTRSLKEKQKIVTDRPWRGAEAFHFLLLCERQFYGNQYKRSVVTAQRLKSYEDFIEVAIIYSLLALTGYCAGFYETCSKALAKLETISTEDFRERYGNLALDIFTVHDPEDPKPEETQCPHCHTSVTEIDVLCPTCFAAFPVCIATGKSIINEPSFQCTSCKHFLIESESKKRQCCPLCHQTL